MGSLSPLTIRGLVTLTHCRIALAHQPARVEPLLAAVNDNSSGEVA